jgi:hypothetical protein
MTFSGDLGNWFDGHERHAELLGAGERRFEGVNLPALGYACTRHASSPLATHVVFARQ